MRRFTAVVEKCPDTGLYVGYEMLMEDGEPNLESEFVGTHTVTVGT